MKSKIGSALDKDVSQKEQKEKSDKNISLPPINPRKGSKLPSNMDQLSEGRYEQKNVNLLRKPMNKIKYSRSQRNKSISHSVEASSQQTKTNADKRENNNQYQKIEVNIIEKQDLKIKNMKKRNYQLIEGNTEGIQEVKKQMEFLNESLEETDKQIAKLTDKRTKLEKLLQQAIEKKNLIEKHLSVQNNQLIKNQEDLNRIQKNITNKQEKKEGQKLEKEVQRFRKVYCQTQSEFNKALTKVNELQEKNNQISTTMSLKVQRRKVIIKKINKLDKVMIELFQKREFKYNQKDY